MADRERPKTAAATTGSNTRTWEPRMWTGMDAASWFKMLARHRFGVGITGVAMAILLSGISVVNTLLNLVHALFYGRKIKDTRIEQDPLFIIGHWRTGTTLLHELLVLDPRHAYPTTYECFGSSHFLLSARFVKWWLSYLMPRKRPMDNMPVGLDRPQEDEFAFCGLGVPSPYMDWAFPNRTPCHQDYLDLRSLTPPQRELWKERFVWFLKSLTYKNPGKRMVLKSPTHTYRVRTLLEIFPNARFVYLVRDPFVVFPSTVNLWKRLQRYHGTQIPKNKGLEEQVFARFEQMHKVFEEDRRLIDPSRFCEVRYEDLVRDPIGQVRDIYEKLDLGEFDAALPALQEYVAGVSEYRTNRFEISPEVRREISRRCAPYIEQYGYAEPSDGEAA